MKKSLKVYGILCLDLRLPFFQTEDILNANLTTKDYPIGINGKIYSINLLIVIFSRS